MGRDEKSLKNTDLHYINKERNFAVTSNLCAFNLVMSADVGSYSCTTLNFVEDLKRKVNNSEMIAYCSFYFNL